MKTLLVGLSLMTIALVVGACGNGTPAPTTTPTPSPTPKPTPTATASPTSTATATATPTPPTATPTPTATAIGGLTEEERRLYESQLAAAEATGDELAADRLRRLLGLPTATPTATSSPTPTFTPIPTRTATPTPTTTPPTVVQYCSSADGGVAADISNAHGWPLIEACSISELGDFEWWVLVGGQFSNPIYRQVFGDAITAADEGHIVIQRVDPYRYEGKERTVWGVAGWSSSDTLSAAAYIINNGLPDRNVKQRY